MASKGVVGVVGASEEKVVTDGPKTSKDVVSVKQIIQLIMDLKVMTLVLKMEMLMMVYLTQSKAFLTLFLQMPGPGPSTTRII